MNVARTSGAARRGRWLWKCLVDQVQRVDPARFAVPSRSAVPGTIGLACIYRRANAQLVADLVEPLASTSIVRLWALDEVDDRLGAMTIGSGPGGRLDLLNRLLEAIGDTCDEVVLTDDDISFVAGDVARLVAFGRKLRLDLFQPAHARSSRCDFEFTRKRWATLGRHTTFVEQGPMVVMSRAAQRSLLPLPSEFGMGWGVEARWFGASDTLRLGIVDAVAVRHDPFGSHRYDVGTERQRLEAELGRVGVTHVSDLQQELHRYRYRPSRVGRVLERTSSMPTEP